MSEPIPTTIRTDRLLLRPVTMADAPAMQHCATWDVARTLTMRYPLSLKMAEAFIENLIAQPADTTNHFFGVERQSDGLFIGGCGMDRTPAHKKAELGYWLGVDYWGKGYATEMAQALVDWGFIHHGLNRSAAVYYTHNAASRRVMDKIGMTFEYVQRQAIYRNVPQHNYRAFIDVGVCSILRDEWEAKRE